MNVKLDQKKVYKNIIRDKILEKNKRITKERPFHLSLDTDQHGMIKCHIDGWMHIDEAKVLWQTIQNRKNCLELGTYKGLSTWILSEANPDCKITSLDIFPENTSAAKLNCVGKNNINFLTEDSNEWLDNSTEKFDWVFVDHSHESFYMDRTIMLLSKCLAEDHLILLHDMHLQGVQQQSYKFANLTRIRNLGIGTLW